MAEHGVRVLGTPVSTIRDTEDRDLFIKRLDEIGVKTARSEAANTIEEALEAARELGYPLMIRAGFALGGLGSGVVQDEPELTRRLEEVFHSTSQVLVEENLSGWKEVEYEVVRDRADNCITVCNMENLDPMGVHTGESFVVAPSQTLSNEEYHRLREIAIRTIRHLGIVGECNIQYALDPRSGDYRVIEVNARLSRSSALASKATGYPLAFVAAKLALGYRLTDIKNSVTGKTTACFEPALDYLVLKAPRWDLAKFDNAAAHIGTEMKSVGEVMAIGRSFEEVLQKALRMLNTGLDGFVLGKHSPSLERALDEIEHPTTRRITALAEALHAGESVARLHELSKIDPWFLEKMRNIVACEERIAREGLDQSSLTRAKRLGFSDKQLAKLTRSTEGAVRTLRKRLRVTPVVKQIDTLAGEFPARTNYLYLTYHGSEHDLKPGRRSQIAVLGGGPYCIGSSVEFDWSSVQALRTLKRERHDTIMINSNPETVSTDYDMSDRLYFEELSLERVLDILDFEKPQGVVISTGGQIPNNLALPLHEHRVNILGTSPANIDRAENRHVFSQMLDELGIAQAEWAELTTPEEAARTAERIGYPVLVRPSYVLSGAAMKVAYDADSLIAFLRRAVDVSSDHPVVISKFIENAREIEIDGVADKGALAIYAITEHVENAGTHSGDATVVLPPQRTYLETIRRAKLITKRLVRALNITGPFNIQFIAKDNHLLVIECNLRASRSFPFVSKVTGHNFIDMAVRAMLGKDISGHYRTVDLDLVAVKSPQFSYGRIKGADPRTGVEMASTGEVACFGDSFSEALLKSMLASGMRLPKGNVLVSVGGEESKIKLLPIMRLMHEMKFSLTATEHTADFLRQHGVPCERVYKLRDKREPNVGALLERGSLDLIINIPTSAFAGETTDGSIIRRKAVDLNIPLITNRQLAEAFVNALLEQRGDGLKTRSSAEYSRG